MPDSRTDDKWHWAIGAATVLVLGVVTAIVWLYTALPERDHSTVVTLLLGLTSTTVVALLALLRSIDNGEQLKQNTEATVATAHTVSELANGSLDAKVRLAVAEVLQPQLIDPAAGAQLAEDKHQRARLDAAAELLRRANE